MNGGFNIHIGIYIYIYCSVVVPRTVITLMCGMRFLYFATHNSLVPITIMNHISAGCESYKCRVGNLLRVGQHYPYYPVRLG